MFADMGRARHALPAGVQLVAVLCGYGDLGSKQKSTMLLALRR